MALCKIEAGAESYYLCLTQHEDDASIDLVLTNCAESWSGSVSKDDMSQMARKLRVTYDDFVTDTRKALTRQNVGSLNFEYSVKVAKGGVMFQWVKFIPSENVRIKLGSTLLRGERDSTGALQAVFDKVIESASQISETIHSLQSDNQRLAADRAAALKRLEKAVSAKEEMETDLYSKFVIVVNDKKSKIRALKQEVDDLRAGVPSTSNNSVGSTKRLSEAIKQESDGESVHRSDPDQSDYETDDEVDVKPSTSRSPAKKSRVADISGDGDLAFEGAEELSPVVTTANRRRRGKQTVKKTPSKPVIPKVPSSESKKTPTSSSRPSLSRRSSSKKSASSDPDFDDLLNAGFD